MEMSWMETFELLGLDLLVAVLLALVVLGVVEHALHQARQATRSRIHILRGSAHQPRRVDVGIVRPA